MAPRKRGHLAREPHSAGVFTPHTGSLVSSGGAHRLYPTLLAALAGLLGPLRGKRYEKP